VGEQQKVPRDSGASASVIGLVGVMPGAIGFVSSGLVMPGAPVKVLKIDGVAPGEPGYPLSGNK
jgi:hypothetical protein